MATCTARESASWVAGLARAIAIGAVAAGLLGLHPRASAQEEPAPPEEVPARTAPPEKAAPPAPGTASGKQAVGWGDRTAAVLHVEGAVEGAPLAAADKPRPQGDRFVQRFRSSRPTSLNSFASDEPDASGVSAWTLGRLLDVDPDHPPQVVPALAVAWEISNGGRQCTYTLRQGVQFADGRPFTSADVKFSFDTLSDPDVTADHLRPTFESVKDVTTPDERTVVVRFRDPHWKAPYVVGHSLRILNSGWYRERIAEKAREMELTDVSVEPGASGFAQVFNQITLPCPGTGPYYLRRKEDFGARRVELSPNPFSWQMQVHPTRHNFAGVRWIELADENEEFRAFVNGDLDVWVVPHETWENQLSRDPRVDAVGQHYVYDHIGIDALAIVWNCRKPPFDDPDLRTAMTHTVDRRRILSQLEQDHGSVAVCRSKRSYPSYSPDLKAHERDDKKARLHLLKAGWDQDDDEDGVLDKDGEPLEFELIVPAGRRYFALLGEMLEQDFRHMRVRMRLTPLEPREFAKALRSRKFDALCGFSSWPDPWIDLYTSYHSSQAKRRGQNVSGWHTEELDELLEAMQHELDPAKRNEMFHRFNRLHYEAQPETLLTHGKVGVLINRRFENVSVRPTGLQSFDLWVRPENVQHSTPDGK